MKLHLRKGDQVSVLSGNERGATGKILGIDRAALRAVVEGVAIRKKHVRRSQDNPKGGVVEKETPIHISNLIVICPKCSKATRVGRKMEENRSVRVCRKCGEAFPS